MISERENQYNAFIANTARNVNEKYTERKDTMFQLMEYPTSTISKRIVLHALSEMRAEHMARFMNESRIRGFNKAKAMLLKMMDQYLQMYMGHKDVSHTAYYIHLLPENLIRSKGVDWESLNAVFPGVELWQD